MIDREAAALAAILLEAAKRRRPVWQTHDPDAHLPMQNTLVPDGAPRHPIIGGGVPQHPFLPIYKTRPPRRS